MKSMSCDYSGATAGHRTHGYRVLIGDVELGRHRLDYLLDGSNPKTLDNWNGWATPMAAEDGATWPTKASVVLVRKALQDANSRRVLGRSQYQQRYLFSHFRSKANRLQDSVRGEYLRPAPGEGERHRRNRRMSRRCLRCPKAGGKWNTWRSLPKARI